MAPSLVSARDIISDAAGVKNTFSSWDSCMSKAYCKWPVIIGIVIGALIALSIITCLVRCLCCGVECCCACFSCCNRCCPSPRGRSKKPDYPPTMPAYSNSTFGQYQSHPPPTYGAGGYRSAAVPQTATFDSPSRTYGHQHADALPAMPSWDQAKTRHVEEEVEMIKIDPQSTPADRLITRVKDDKDDGMLYENPDPAHSGDIGHMATSPYRDHHDPNSPYGYGANDGYGQAIGTAHSGSGYNATRSATSPSSPQYHSRDQYDTYGQSQLYNNQARESYGHAYEPPRQNWAQSTSPTYPAQQSHRQFDNATPYGYESTRQQSQVAMPYPEHDHYQPQTQASVPYPDNDRQPGYHAFSPTSPHGATSPNAPFMGRKPVQGSWRDV